MVHKYAKGSSRREKLIASNSLTRNFAADLGLAENQ